MHVDIQTIFNVIFGFFVIVGGIIYIVSAVRKNDLKILRDANTDLRNSIDDKSKQIDSLTLKVAVLEKRVAVLETQNNDLSILVREALVMYFTRNPKVAEQTQDKIKAGD